MCIRPTFRRARDKQIKFLANGSGDVLSLDNDFETRRFSGTTVLVNVYTDKVEVVFKYENKR